MPRRSLLGASAAWLGGVGGSGQALAAGAQSPAAHAFEAPNPVRIGPNLLTSGQPSREALLDLSKLGIQRVMYLVPPGAADAVSDEADVLRHQGIEFLTVPIPFAAPTPAHAQAVSLALLAKPERHTLVHCQLNYRASSMVFLHRIDALREDPAQAYEAVSRVWTPEGAWRRLLLERLRALGKDFEPF